MAYFLMIFFLITSVSAAELPPACAPTESYEMCGLIVQRNNAENDLINMQAKANRLDDSLAQTAAYWKAYVDGIETQRRALDAYWASWVAGVEMQKKEAAKKSDYRAARAAEAARSGVR